MGWTHRTIVLITVLLVSVTGPALGMTPTAEFSSQTHETAAGETAEIGISLSDTDSATVKIGSDRVNYIATVEVRDENDDQDVTLQYNTSKAGHDGGFSAADDADTVTVTSETEFKDGQLLDAGTYELAVAPSDESIEDATDTATLEVTDPIEPTTESETTTKAPGPYAGHVTDIEDGVVVAPAKNQTITGNLDVEPGTEITVRSKSKTINLLRSQTTTVTEDGRFRVSFDFSGLPSEVENGTEFEITILANGDRQKDVTGVFQTPPTMPEPTTVEPTTREPTTTTNQAIQDETTHDAAHAQDGTIPGFSLATGVLALVAITLLALRGN